MSLKLNEFILEVMARQSGDDLVALLWSIFVKSNSNHVHQHTRVGERDFGSHVLGYAGCRVQRDCFPDKIRPRLWNPTASEEFTCGVGAINFESLGLGFIRLDQTHVVK